VDITGNEFMESSLVVFGMDGHCPTGPAISLLLPRQVS